ncbi:MAG: hypothetical protein GWP21_00905 [Euryarchaeota archaeon]|nr:hypothetical protein [Euryarchaeota archaeon]
MESADFVMFYFEGHNPEQFGPGQHYVTLDQLPSNLRNASAEQAVVAIELTTQNPGNSNAVQRMGRVEDHTNLGIPFLYVSPIDSIRLDTGAGIAGGHGDSRLKARQKQLVRNNLPTEETTLAGYASVGACPFDEPCHDPQKISGWTEQCLLIHGDSNRVNTAHLTLPRMWSFIHDSYRYSGSQLTAVYDFMGQVMEDTASSGIAAGRASLAWTPHISATRGRAALGVNRGRGSKHTDLRSYGETYGYPMGAIRILDGSFNHYSEPHHYESRAQMKSLTAMELGTGAKILAVFNTYCSGFTVDSSILSLVIAAVGGRHFLLSRNIPKKKYLSKDTYTGSMHITDWLFTREPAPHWDINVWPRAVSNNPQNRLHIYAVEGPWTSVQANASASTTDVYGRRTRARVDLYRCSNGVYIGQPLADLIGVPIFTPLAN